MKIIIFFLFLFTISCNKQTSDNLVDINFYINQGEKIKIIKELSLAEKDIYLLKKIQNLKFSSYKNWVEQNYNSNNFITPSKLRINKKKKYINKKIDNFIIYEKKIISIDKKSNIQIYDLNFNKIISSKIYNRKTYKNFDLTFKILTQNNNLFISDNLGNIHAYDLENLKIIWKKNFAVPFVSSIKIHKNNLFLLNTNSKLFSVNSNTGNINWTYETSSKNLKDKESYRIAIYKDKLFFTNDSSEIYCINLNNNSIIWSLVFESENFQNSPLILKYSPITIDNNGNLFISSNLGKTHKIDTETGAVKWSTPIFSSNRFLNTEKYLLNVYKDRLFILDKSSGKVLFNQKIINLLDQNKKFFFKDLVVGSSKIYLFDANGYIASIDLNNVQNYRIEKEIKSYTDLIIFENNLFVRSNDSINKF